MLYERIHIRIAQAIVFVVSALCFAGFCALGYSKWPSATGSLAVKVLIIALLAYVAVSLTKFVLPMSKRLSALIGQPRHRNQ